MTNDFDSWAREHESKFIMVSWVIMHSLLFLGIIILLFVTFLMFQHIFGIEEEDADQFKPSNNYTSMCSPTYIIMQQWLNNAKDYRCYNT